MKGVCKRLATGVRVILESSSAQAVLAAAYDPDHGVWPVELYLKSTVLKELGRMLFSGELTTGFIVHIEAVEHDKARLHYRIEESESA